MTDEHVEEVGGVSYESLREALVATERRERKLREAMDGLGLRANDAEADREKAESRVLALSQSVAALIEEIIHPSDPTQRLVTLECARVALAENGDTND